MIGIYVITNLVNDKKYIGQSVDIERRISNHKWALKHNRHCNVHLQSSFNKYGENCFDFSCICECKEDELDSLEKHYIFYYDCMNPCNGYNSESGGSANKHWSDELRKKIKEFRRHKENNGMYGKHHTEETKAILREKRLGKKLSVETKQKISESHKGKLSKPVYCVEADMIFPSSLEAAEFAGLKSRSSIFENIAG